jgi:hypothetical protein
MVIHKRLLIITAGDCSYEFRVNIHRAEYPSLQMIEPAFYTEFAGKIHPGTQHEMELVKSPVWRRVNPDVPIHIHQNPESKLYFICFSGNIPTIEAALNVLRLWCVGTVYAITHNADFGAAAKELGTEFVDVMQRRCRIVISGDREIAE